MKGVAKLIILVVAVGAVSLVAARSDSDSEDFELAGHQFIVPKDHLFELTIPWLPASETDAFTFLLEPNPNPDQIPKHRILVERLSRFCPTDATPEATQMLRIACGQEQPAVDDAPPYVKLQNELGSWSSNLFSVENEPGDDGVRAKRMVAYCQLFEPNPAKPEPSTLCTTFWSHDGMMLQFSFDESESSEMPAMKVRAMALLDSWEVR